jgi:hypothetical protein
MVTESGDLVVLAVQRKGEDLPGETVLAVGDTLLLEGAWGALEERLDDPEVLVVDEPRLIRRQVPLGPGAKRALVVLAAMVALLATGPVPPAVAGLLAAGAIVVGRVLTIQEAYRGISWTTVVLVAGMLPLSTAMTDTGAAARLGDLLVDLDGDSGPYVLLLALFLLTAAFGAAVPDRDLLLALAWRLPAMLRLQRNRFLGGGRQWTSGRESKREPSRRLSRRDNFPRPSSCRSWLARPMSVSGRTPTELLRRSIRRSDARRATSSASASHRSAATSIRPATPRRSSRS